MIKEVLRSPLGSGDAVLKRRIITETFRKDIFDVIDHYYECEQTGEEFGTEETENLHKVQVENQYRDKYGLPFPDQIRRIREAYNVSASKMSEILGLGANSYRSYELGEVPSVGNGRFIKSAQDPGRFLELLRMSQEVIGPEEFEKLTKRVSKMIEINRREIEKRDRFVKEELFPSIVPDQFTGYRLADVEKISHMILFFSEKMQTWKTKLNKLLFYSDFMCFKHTGYGMSGLKYQAWQMGPVPFKFDELFIYIDSVSEVVERVYAKSGRGNYGTVFRKTGDFNEELFSSTELTVLREVERVFGGLVPGKVIDKSHRERAWKENHNEMKDISYMKYGFELKEM